MTQYAKNTTVSVEKSRTEIEKMLVRYGATGFAYGWSGNRAVLQFEAQGRHIRFDLPIPDRFDKEFTRTPTGKMRAVTEADKAWEQAQRQRWRALLLIIKAKLEAIESGIVTFENEFLAHVVLPSGATVGQWAATELDAVYSSGQMPELLPGGES